MTNFVEYTVSDGKVTITKYRGTDTEVIIPSEIDGKPVKRIGDSAFRSCISLTSVIIPDSVTSIGSWAFEGCSSLTSVEIPNSVTSIGTHAFSHCISLTSITIPDSVTSIGEKAFAYCSSLKSVTIPDSVTSLEDSVFRGCSSLTCVTIGNSVTSIGDGAFYNCSGLTSATIPDSVTSIEAWAFDGCSSLTSVEIPNSVTSIGAFAFRYCNSLKSVEIPDSVTSIGMAAFGACKSLMSIEIPDSVTSIGDRTFEYCSNLTSVTIPDSVTSIGDEAFYGCDSLTCVTIPDSVTSIGDEAFYGCNSLDDIRYTGAEEQLKQIKIKKEGKEMSKMSKLIEQMNGLNNFEVILGAYRPWRKGENKILARKVVKSFQEALPCLKDCIKFYDNFYTIFKERENITLWLVVKAKNAVVLDSDLHLDTLKELIEPNKEVDRKTTIPQVSICRESVVSLYIRFNSCTLYTKWDFDWYQTEDAEYQVQELALNLMDCISHSAIEFEGEIHIQEFEYDTPTDETTIFINENGMCSNYIEGHGMTSITNILNEINSDVTFCVALKAGQYTLCESECATIEEAKSTLLPIVKFYVLFREVIKLTPMLWAVDKAGQKTLIMNSNSLLQALLENRKELDEFFKTDWFTSFCYIDHYWSNEIPVAKECTVTLRIPTLEGIALQINWEFAWYQTKDSEAKVQELVTKLLQTNVGGEILLQEFEHETPSNCYAVTVGELGEVYTNFS